MAFRLAIFCLLLITAVSAQPGGSLADVACKEWGKKCRVEVGGSIKNGDYLLLSKMFAKPRPDERSSTLNLDGLVPVEIDGKISLNSEGGDVQEALKIGRFIRDNNIHVVVPVKKRCASACVFVLMAGVDRGVYGSVGIHRPYFASFGGASNSLSIKENYKIIRNELYEYARTMNVPESLIDHMYRVEPEKIEILSKSDLSKYGLNVVDPAYDEYVVMSGSREFLITPVEYRRRRALVVTECYEKQHKDIEDLVDCARAVELGVGLYEYRSRVVRYLGHLKDNQDPVKPRKCFVNIMITGLDEC